MSCGSIYSQIQNNGIGDTIHAIHYSIHLEDVNTAQKSIAAYAEIEITPLVSNINYVALQLLYLTTDSVFVDNSAVTFSHDDSRLNINLNNPISVNDTIAVKVYYHGQPFSEDWGGFHFSGNYAFNLGVGFVSIPHNLGKTWFPCIDNFTDRADYDLFATVATGLTVTGGGLLLDTINNGNNTTTWHWKQQHKIPTYLFSVAIGNYVEYKDEYIGIEDTIPISIFTLPSNIGNVAGSFVNLHTILNFFEAHFGPYPFEKVGYTSTAIGAMEHASNIAYPYFAIDGETTYEYLYTHELSHMWFGDKVTCSSAEDMWLNEGWATFCELYYLTGLYSNNQFITGMRVKHRNVLQNAYVTDGGYWALNNIPQEYTYGKTAYDKGATVVNTLRNYLGDSLFFNAITAYLNTDSIAYHSMSSYELRDFLTDYTGINMTPFFDAWVMTPGVPHFSIDSTHVNTDSTGFIVNIWLKQKHKGYNFIADDNIIDVIFIDADFNFYTDTVHFSGSTGHSVKHINNTLLSSQPIATFIDMYEKMEDATIDNYKYFTEPEDYKFPQTYFTILIDELSDSSLIRVTNNWVAPDSLKTHIDGLRLSPSRYWKVEGVFDESYQARGKFYYSNTGYLDDSLIFSENDSVIILYRSNTHNDWHEIPQTRIGLWSIGNIYVDNLLPGEYTLAVWNKQIVGLNSNNPKLNDVKIYPNPSKGNINFKFRHKGVYSINLLDEAGKQIDKIDINAKKYSWMPKSNNLTSGIVIVQISEKGKVIALQKIILIK